MSDEVLRSAIDRIPSGAWAVGVSGGADSVALLALLRERRELRLHVAHLDHQTRAGASAIDAAFVGELCARWGIPSMIALRSRVEPHIAEMPANLSARFRAARLALFRQVVREHQLDGVILAHHADDQAETVLLRLARGAGLSALAGMSHDTWLGGLRILRPLLGVRHDTLVAYLESIGQPWREDPSNVSPRYRRSRARRILAAHPQLVEPLLSLGQAASAARRWLGEVTPRLGDSFAAQQLAALPPMIADYAARAWLVARGAPTDDVSPASVARLKEMATDAASPVRQHFPGRLLVRRRSGIISCERAAQ